MGTDIIIIPIHSTKVVLFLKIICSQEYELKSFIENVTYMTKNKVLGMVFLLKQNKFYYDSLEFFFFHLETRHFMECYMRKKSEICLYFFFSFARKALKKLYFLLEKNLIWEILGVHFEKNSQSITLYYFWKFLTALWGWVDTDKTTTSNAA